MSHVTKEEDNAPLTNDFVSHSSEYITLTSVNAIQSQVNETFTLVNAIYPEVNVTLTDDFVPLPEDNVPLTNDCITQVEVRATNPKDNKRHPTSNSA